jgi:hypothetical protein
VAAYVVPAGSAEWFVTAVLIALNFAVAAAFAVELVVIVL